MHDMGFALIYLLPKSKRPLATKWTEGPRMSWAQFDKDFKQSYNVGVRLGGASKFEDGTFLCVLDCDVKSREPKHLKEMQKALDNFCGVSDFAPKVLSGRGGGSCHIYVRTPSPQQSFKALRSTSRIKVFMPSVSPSQADREGLNENEIQEGYRMRLAWEIDVFGEGKQVVLPPSIHPDTNASYLWDGEPPASWESIPRVKNFEMAENKKKPQKRGLVEFKGAFVNVDLLDVNIDTAAFDLIVSGRGVDKFPSRSEALFSALNSLTKAGLKDHEVISVLTDAENFMSEKALEKGSREAGAEWLCGQLEKVRQDFSKSKAFLRDAYIEDMDEILGLTTEEALEQEHDLISKHWTDKLEVTSKGGYRNTAHNLFLILKNLYRESDSKIPKLLAWDEFNERLIYVDSPPWGSKTDVGRAIEDLDLVQAKIWLSRDWSIETSTSAVFEVFSVVGEENSFHPIKKYLESLKWDGVPRVKNLFKFYTSATGNPKYLSTVGTKMLCAAIARVYQPGVKFDQIVILEGLQGIGKSRFCQALASKEWFTDNLGDISNKDVVDVMAGKWLIEMGELAGLRKAEENELKAFITRTHDKVRKAYGRLAKEYPRQCIFIGTTNNETYLKDETGGRRYWPVETHNFKITELEKDRDQLWAEALVKYKAGEKLWIEDVGVRETALEMQASRRVVDHIESVLSEAIAANDLDKSPFSFPELWEVIQDKFMSSKLACDGPLQHRIYKALRALNYRCKTLRIGEKTVRKWVRF